MLSTMERKPSKPPDRFLNFKEVAEMIGLAVETVKKGKAGTKDLPRIRAGRRVLFSLNAVQAWMSAKAAEAEESKRRSRAAVIDLLSEKSRRRQAIDDTLKTIINGGKYR